MLPLLIFRPKIRKVIHLLSEESQLKLYQDPGIMPVGMVANLYDLKIAAATHRHVSCRITQGVKFSFPNTSAVYESGTVFDDYIKL